MKVTLKEAHYIVYEQRTHQITVEIDGEEYIVRQTEDDNGCDFYVFHKDFENGWTKPYELEEGELQETLSKLANFAHDDFIFSTSKEGKEVDMDELEDY